jgi:Ca-activated chloride channel family protein
MPDAFRVIVRAVGGDWRGLTLADVRFAHGGDARLLLLGFAGLTVVVLAVRLALDHRPGKDGVVLPAIPLSLPRSMTAAILQVPVLLFLAGLPFLALAVADPYTALVRREASYPGRRICLAIDASNSMSSPFKTEQLRTQSPNDAAFFTTVAAAERFVQMRMNGRYRDLVGLVEFGSEAYVVTPFTSDYDNILLSLSLIGEPHEFASFPDSRTLIARAIEESVELFKAFNFLDASGNLLVIFSDGEDTLAAAHGRSLDDIIAGAVQAGVPVYFVRTNYDQRLGQFIPDQMWMDAVNKTGGKFFAASDERSLLAAINEIDQVSAGRIQLTEYSSQERRFSLFAALAALCFAAAATAKVTVPYFRKFP